jgi:O-antigen ligase
MSPGRPRRRVEVERMGKSLFFGGLAMFALSSSFSISLTEGGIILAWIGFVLRLTGKRPARRALLLDYVIVAYLAWEFITVLTSPERSMSLKAYRSEWLVLTYFLVSLGTERTAHLERVLKTLAVAASLLATYGIIQHFTGIDYIKHKELAGWYGRFMSIGLLGHHITFGIFYAWIFALTLAFASMSHRLRSGLTWAGLSCLASVAVLYSYSRGAWLSAVSAFLVVAVMKRLRLGYAVLLVVVVTITVTLSEPPFLQRATVATQETMMAEDMTRILLLRTAFNMIADNPVFGLGPGTFMAEFDAYKVPGDYSTTCHPHNDFVNSAVRSGILGTVLFVTILILSLRIGLGLYRNSTDPAVKRLAVGLVAGLVALTASSMFQCSFGDSEIAIQAWFIIGSLAALLRLESC